MLIALKKLTTLLEQAQQTILVTGAGISTTCGYPGLAAMNKIALTDSEFHAPILKLLTNRYAQSHPQEFYRMYRKTHFRPQALPSSSHLALAHLEKAGLITGIITFNLDYLHTLAGSKKVLEYWGSINENFCVAHHHSFGLEYLVEHPIPHCPFDGSLILPVFVLRNMVAFKKRVAAGRALLKNADLVIICGTQLHHNFPETAANIVVINDQPLRLQQEPALFIQGKLDSVFDALLTTLPST
ncbi:SIR2 family NAD-dependent protein deacylase [Liquorilactobacillus satsumensis]|uniref:SIR2 family NAD-dependent protein deacylase n=1 Tax=Liquorilactobacillus satsumensis TaxID=259059 RepID=UPI0021C2E0D0|nr:Sir2 family NAD-dependent protein deacetylase [Liquorilactobacillus satsumensis]MCP9328714.1 NAD-dependent deacetylase [Liquorilactobacillus satsumensis]